MGQAIYCIKLKTLYTSVFVFLQHQSGKFYRNFIYISQKNLSILKYIFGKNSYISDFYITYISLNMDNQPRRVLIWYEYNKQIDSLVHWTQSFIIIMAKIPRVFRNDSFNCSVIVISLQPVTRTILLCFFKICSSLYSFQNWVINKQCSIYVRKRNSTFNIKVSLNKNVSWMQENLNRLISVEILIFVSVGYSWVT
jgi:hypothetical protein